MKRYRRSALYLSIVVALSLAVLAACSKKSSNPYSPGGGGGGTTLNLDLVAGGGSASFTFATAGTFAYKCKVHPTIMFGDTVFVSGSSATDSVVVNVVGLSTPGFGPSNVTIKTGGKVRWVNSTGITHGVINN
jgi:plastocyanin